MAGENEEMPQVMIPADDDAPTEADDGLTPEERAHYDAMQAEPEVPGAPDEGAAPPPAGDVPPAPELGEGDDDDGEGEGEGEPAALGQPAKDGQPGERRRPRRVSSKTFDQEIARRETRIKELEDREREAADMRARMEERLAIINEALTPKQQAQADDDPEPDPNEDIFAHAAWMGRRNSRLEATIQEMQAARQQETEDREVAQAYESDAVNFVRREPAFVDAYQFLVGSRVAELSLHFFGKEVTELAPAEQHRVAQEFQREERALSAKALRSGRSPAEMVWSLAKARGFTPKAPAAPDPAAAKPDAGKPNGKAEPGRVPGNLADAADAAAADKLAKPNVAEEIKRIRQGSEAALSLSQGAGAAPRTLTYEMIANMDQEEFNRLVDQLHPDDVRRLMGG